MRLKSIAFLFVGTLSVIALLVSIALITMTAALHRASVNLLTSTRSIVAVEELETSLLVHSREGLLWTITGDRGHLTKRNAAREDLTRWFDEVRQHIGSEHEQELIRKAESAVMNYLTAESKLERSNAPLPELASGIGQETDEAIRRLQHVSDLNLEQASELTRQSEKTDAFATWMGIIAAILILGATPTIIWLLRWMIFKPVLEIATSLQAFRRHRSVGQASDGAKKGAVELKAISTELSALTFELVKQRTTQIRYLSAVAHDLRNPIGAITMGAELMLNEFSAKLSPDAKDILNVIQRQSVHLERMVSDLLDTTRAENGDLELKKSNCDLRTVVKGSVDLFSRYSRSHRLSLDCPSEPLLIAMDSTRLSQVMNNLISNAIKYSPYGGEVQIAIERRQKEAIVSVRDSGIGISAEDQSAIFEPFRRASATKDTIPGVGLGLFTARKIVLAHGGALEVHSAIGEGSTFAVRLPNDSSFSAADRQSSV